ncbi:type I CRISPR-associated protein Cas7 [Pseudogracilibacillus sp. SO30301A]
MSRLRSSLALARSCDRITPLDMNITRVALSNSGESDKNIPYEEGEARYGQMGRKAYVTYGMYITYGFYSPSFAKQTG